MYPGLRPIQGAWELSKRAIYNSFFLPLKVPARQSVGDTVKQAALLADALGVGTPWNRMGHWGPFSGP